MNGRDDSLLQARIAFHGRIVASATHEFQNHFAVIKEYNGLIGDLLRSGKSDPGGAIKRCVEISASINDRADRAARLMDTLNRFAHRGDVAVAGFKVDDVVAELVALLQRTADQNRISLRESRAKGAPEITNNPSLLQYLLWSLLAPLLESLAENSRITISASRRKDGAAVIEIKTRGQATAAAGSEPSVAGLVAAVLDGLGASLSRESGRGDREEIQLAVPSLAPAPAR